MNEEKYCSNSNKGKAKFKDLVEFIKSLSIPERKKLIDEIQVDNYFNELDSYEVITNSE